MAGRTYYASQAVGIHPYGQLGESANFSDGSTIAVAGGVKYKQRILDGVQSVGFSSNVEFEQIFELGHLQIFENIEGSPSCEATLERALPLNSPSLLEVFGASGNDYGVNMSRLGNDVGMSLRLGVNADGGVMTNISAGSANRYGIQVDGFTSSYSISAQTDGAVTESLGIAGINLFVIPSGTSSSSKIPQPATSSPSGVFRRQDTGFASRSIQSDNTVDAIVAGNYYNRVQSASISVDIGREDLLEMGRKGPYIRYASFPVEVTAEVEYAVDTTSLTAGGHVMSADGIMTRITADTECDITAGKGRLVEIRGARRVGSTCDATHKTLNTSAGTVPSFAVGISGAKLQSQNWSGGDTGGGVVTISESFTSFNNIRGTTTSNGVAKPA